MKIFTTITLIFLSSLVLFSQEIKKEQIKDSLKLIKEHKIAIKPTKVGFYSAVLPGLGQAYNKDYWKIPFVYAALAGSTYLYIHNDDLYKDYRSQFKRKKLGDQSVETTFEVLERAQEYHRKKRDGNMLLILGVYVLQIVEASVDAHLQYHRIDRDLSLSPKFIRDSGSGKTQVVASFNFRF